MKPEESVPMLIVKPPACITLWVIYDHPIDAPHAFVLRPHFVLADSETIISPLAWYASTIDELRSILPPGVVRMIETNPNIAEVWME